MEATDGSIADGQVFYVDSASPEDEAALDARWQRFCSEILRMETDAGDVHVQS